MKDQQISLFPSTGSFSLDATIMRASTGRACPPTPSTEDIQRI
jgi:hypothetical protein